MKKKTNFGLKIICLNRKASFNYFFQDLIEAGIVLKGSEIKSIRSGKVKRARLYYLRDRKGKSARIVEKIKKKNFSKNDLKMIKKGYMGVGLHYFLGMKDNNDVKEFINRLKHYKKTEF